MARSPKRDRPKLTFEQVNTLCQAFVPVGDALFDIRSGLQAAGFAAWLPYEEFTESFGTEEEVRIHRQFIAELAKTRLGVPWPWRLGKAELAQCFRSPFILQRNRQRDELNNGIAINDLSKHYPGGESVWRREADPCRRKMAFAEINDGHKFDAQWHSVKEKMRLLLDEEVEQHATGLARSHTFGDYGRFDFFVAVMDRDASALGFRHDKAKSRRDYPVFSKSIGSSEWDLCWTIDVPSDFLWNPIQGYFDPILSVQHRAYRGDTDKGTMGDLLLLRYRHVLSGFWSAYWEFFDLDDLETMIKANICLYGLMAPIIEGGLKQVLGGEGLSGPAHSPRDE